MRCMEFSGLKKYNPIPEDMPYSGTRVSSIREFPLSNSAHGKLSKHVSQIDGSA